ncbi:hypothetical protein OU5_P0010 (plasmid) [Pseudomonas mandelii JR-1]|uniref:Uncharacterized protein n=1 Tax=Pseudomonas mandelii JR-1 TaxID=1147786 RepID=A0A024EKF8_9PSED|nr:hypothetical protein OU5_P0010 [Pseudomonas mandelii JR-1]
MPSALKTSKQSTTWLPEELSDAHLASGLLTRLAFQDQAGLHHSDYFYKAADLYDG